MVTSMFHLNAVAVYVALPFLAIGLVLSIAWIVKKMTTFEQYVHVTVVTPSGKHAVRRLLARGRKGYGINRYSNDMVTVFWRDDSPNVLRMRRENGPSENGEKNAIAAYLEPLSWNHAMSFKEVGKVTE